MTNPFPFRDNLRESLVNAARRRRRRHRTQRALAVTAAFLLATTAIVAGMELRPEPTVASVLEITREGEYFDIKLKDFRATPEQIEKELREAGLQTSVEAIPVSPGLVGTFVKFMANNATENSHFSQQQVRLAPTDDIVIYLGRNALPGEGYESSGPAFAKNEPLHCTGLRKKPAEALQAFADQHGYTTRWTHMEAMFVSPIEYEQARGLLVADVIHTAPTELFVTVSTDGTLYVLHKPDTAQDCG